MNILLIKADPIEKDVNYMKNIQENFIDYIADKGKKVILNINIIVTILFLIFFLIKPTKKYIDTILNGYITDFLVINSSNLISLSAIFIGIYFTIFTLISTLNLNSSIAKLADKYFKMIITYIRNAFLFTFIYVIYLLLVNQINHLLTTETNFYISCLNLLNFLFFIYILLASIRIATLLYAAFNVDITNLKSVKDNAKKEQENIDSFISDTRNFIIRSENNYTKLNSSIKELETFLNEQKKKEE